MEKIVKQVNKNNNNNNSNNKIKCKTGKNYRTVNKKNFPANNYLFKVNICETLEKGVKYVQS